MVRLTLRYVNQIHSPPSEFQNCGQATLTRACITLPDHKSHAGPDESQEARGSRLTEARRFSCTCAFSSGQAAVRP